ncbi:hypothetical protein HPP92_026640 [Vanilla planifolia]|uniref:Uncharacterized protein n=1 Tax=Vanilla planifolia TaxID=51239 RepID=A0A835PBF7_VANPL|nr:hypothetical protein HPP92_026858 [Vanilla planifolia]KAG0450624.1 hypothetical protein HPP92_026640 [Vanilla planifolia]
MINSRRGMPEGWLKCHHLRLKKLASPSIDALFLAEPFINGDQIPSIRRVNLGSWTDMLAMGKFDSLVEPYWVRSIGSSAQAYPLPSFSRRRHASSFFSTVSRSTFHPSWHFLSETSWLTA